MVLKFLKKPSVKTPPVGKNRLILAYFALQSIPSSKFQVQIIREKLQKPCKSIIQVQIMTYSLKYIKYYILLNIYGIINIILFDIYSLYKYI